MTDKKANMYHDSVKQWNIAVGCLFDCSYCVPSFQRQMKRQMPTIDINGKRRGCQDCYDYIPHFHENRLKDRLPRTKGDEFIWVCSSGDITFFPNDWMEQILTRVRELPHKTFFFQTKNPKTFERFVFPDNTLLGTTIESNRYYPTVSKAPKPETRYKDFLKIKHPRKVMVIEPIMQFDLWTLVKWTKDIEPERVYIGYDTKKCGLIEPILAATNRLVQHLQFFTKVKLKYIPEKVK